MLIIVLLGEAVLMPVADQTLGVVRILVHASFCRLSD